MQATIISIGDEILIGQTVNTNSAWMGRQLSALGVQVREVICCSDSLEHITESLHRAAAHSQLVLITGGLGPTKDDVTKHALVRYFETELVLNEELWQRMQQFFAKRGKEVVEMNRSQAMIPRHCEMLPNQRGTAQGMWFERQGVVYVSMPGVPYEMQHIMEEQVLPRLRNRYKLPPLFHFNMMTAGAGESQIATHISRFEESLPPNIKLAYLPEPGVVKLRLTASGSDGALKEIVQQKAAELKTLLGNWWVCDGEKRLEAVLGEMLLQQNATVSCAESCTGGYLSHLFTSVPGSSQYFEGSVISYSYAVKEKLLNVRNETLNTAGAVSEACVLEMLSGLLNASGTTYGIAISGIAGPGGGTDEKPVGTVWIAVGSASKAAARRFQFFPSRTENIRVFSNTALNLLRLFMLDKL